MLESTKTPKTLDDHHCLVTQTPPQQTPQPVKPGQPLDKAEERVLLGSAFPNVFLSTAHISEYAEAKRRPQKWKIGRRKKKSPQAKI